MRFPTYLFVILACCSCSAPGLKRDNLLGRAPWDFKSSMPSWCEVREEPYEGSEPPERELTVVDALGHRRHLLRTADSFLAMYPLGERNALFLTVWVTGSAYKVRVVARTGASPKIVLDAGSKSFPEVISRDTGSAVILLGDVSGNPARPENWTANRYSWDGKGMTRLDEVPFSARLNKLPE